MKWILGIIAIGVVLVLAVVYAILTGWSNHG